MANSDSTKTAADQSRESYADDAKARRNVLVDGSSKVISSIHPLPTDGDSVYEKDLDDSFSDLGGFTGGTIASLFNTTSGAITDSSATNPKYFEFGLNRRIDVAEISLSTDSGNFSNVKIIGKDVSGTQLFSIDDSSGGTKKTSNTYVSGHEHASTFRIEFHTEDPVSVSFVRLEKINHVNAHLHALKPDGTDTRIDATNGGNLKISLEELESGMSVNSNSQLKVTRYDSYGSEDFTPKTAFGDLRIAEISPIFQTSFEYTVDNTELTKNTVNGSATVTQSDAMAVISTGTTTGSKAELSSQRSAKYRPGLGSLIRFTSMFTTGVSGTSQWAGLLDDTGVSEDFKNGFAVGYNGDTFGIARFQDDTLHFTALSSCDDPLDGTGPSGMTVDLTKLNVFAIQFQYLGAGAIIYSIEDDSTGEIVPFHTIHYVNQNTTPSVHSPNFHMIYYADNGATTSDLVIKAASFAYFVEGNVRLKETHQPQFSSIKQTSTSVTSEVAVFTIRNKSTYASKTNFIEVFMENWSASIEASSANNLGEIRLVKNATLGGTPSYSDINTTDSVVEIDTSGTTVTGGKEVFSLPLAGKNDKIIESLTEYIIILAPNETLTVAASSANSATVNSALLWKELF